MRARDPGDKRTAIERALESIPHEVRFRVPGEGMTDSEPEPEKPDPEPVAAVSTQRSLFPMETSDE